MERIVRVSVRPAAIKPRRVQRVHRQTVAQPSWQVGVGDERAAKGHRIQRPGCQPVQRAVRVIARVADVWPAKGTAQVSMQTGVPCLFAVVTTDTLEQAINRTGVKAGNKGFEAAMSAVELVNLYKTMDSDEAPTKSKEMAFPHVV